MPYSARFTLISLIALCTLSTIRAADPYAITDRQREEWKLHKFYQKQTDAGGLLVVGSAKVTDNALAEAAWIVGRMLDGRADILKAMKENRVRAVVMAAEEMTTDVPEHAYLKPKLFWDRRARGLGATLANPVVSCAEENLLDYPRDPYPSENIFVHEFAHAIHGTGLVKTDTTFDKRLKASFEAALERGLWKNSYAGTNRQEYWATGTQVWFDTGGAPDALRNGVRTRAKLKEYDPTLAKLCEEVYGDGDWRYLRPKDRKAEDRKHLVDYDVKKLPTFRWREVPIGDKANATIQTSLGDFDIEVDAKAEPYATAVFLKIALEGGYHSGEFHRGTRDPDDKTHGSITAKINPAWSEVSLKKLKLHELKQTANRPVDGTIAMIRDDKVTGQIVVFLGEPPEETGDIVPFGKVVKGKEVVKKILAAPLDGEKFKSPTSILRVIRNE